MSAGLPDPTDVEISYWRPFLGEGETLIWAAHPPFPFFVDVKFLLWVAVYAAFAAVWTLGAFSFVVLDAAGVADLSWARYIFGGAVIFISVHIFVANPVTYWLMRFAITSERVLIRRGFIGRTLISIPLGALGPYEVSGDRRGTVAFLRDREQRTVGFIGIQQPRQVAALLDRLTRTASQAVRA
ncbi:MAG: hypothetical protein AAFV19_14480 [Pseudomonadota bacterium]